jgi:hypothetical protein
MPAAAEIENNGFSSGRRRKDHSALHQRKRWFASANSIALEPLRLGASRFVLRMRFGGNHRGFLLAEHVQAH